MPTGAAVVENVAHRTVVVGVAGSGLNVIGERVVPYGFVASPQSVNDVVATMPANAAFLPSDIVTALARFWVVPIVAVWAAVCGNAGLVIVAPEETAAMISSPGR